MMIRQVGKRYKALRFSWKLTAKAASLIAIFLISIMAINQFRTISYFPIKEVNIIGAQHIDHQEMQNLLLPFVKRGFFAVDVELIKEQLNQFPWVREASVRRVWPNQVIINVSEKTALARWNDDTLLSTNGDIFKPGSATFPSQLPQLSGPEGKHIDMIENFNKINSILGPLHFKITRLELDPAESWSLTLDNGMKIHIGRKDILTKINHFVKVYPKIVNGRTSDIDYVDLRYSNGLAVRWKTIT